MHPRGLLPAVGFTALVLSSPGAPAPAQPVGRAGDAVDVVEIEVPVRVLEDGVPVRGLTRDDFVVTAGGRRREIRGFSVVDLGAAEPGDAHGAPFAAPPLAARRHVLILFDLGFAGIPELARARDAAWTLVRERLHPTDLVSVASFSLGRGLRVAVGFTPDHQQAEDAITFLGSGPERAFHDPLGLVFAGPGATDVGVANLGGIGSGVGTAARGRLASGDEGLLRALEEQSSFELLGQAYKSLTRELTELAESLRPVAGQKHVFYLSEGADSSRLLGVGRGATFRERQNIEATNEAAMRGEVWSVNSDQRFGSTHDLVQFEAMLEAFVRAGATIQSIDIGGLRAEHDGQAVGDDTLFMMARKTGGEYIRNHNDLEHAFAKALSRTDVTYLLTFEAEAGAGKGRYERIKVRLDPKRRGVVLDHRPGYFQPVPYAERSPAQRRAEAAQWLLDERRRDDLGLAVDVRVPPRPSFAVPVEVELRVPTSDLASGTGVEFFVYAFTADGRVAAYFDHVAEVPADGAESSLRARGELALDPGTYDLRILARETASGGASTRALSLEVTASGEPGAGT